EGCSGPPTPASSPTGSAERWRASRSPRSSSPALSRQSSSVLSTSSTAAVARTRRSHPRHRAPQLRAANDARSRRSIDGEARLLGIGLPLTIVAGTLLGAGVLPGVSWVEALVLAIMLACTDAALGQAVVTDERIPSRIRQGLNVESGLNDGICVPLFFIALG